MWIYRIFCVKILGNIFHLMIMLVNILRCVTVGQYFAICGWRRIYGRSRERVGHNHHHHPLCCDRNQLTKNTFTFSYCFANIRKGKHLMLRDIFCDTFWGRILLLLQRLFQMLLSSFILSPPQTESLVQNSFAFFASSGSSSALYPCDSVVVSK